MRGKRCEGDMSRGEGGGVRMLMEYVVFLPRTFAIHTPSFISSMDSCQQ